MNKLNRTGFISKIVFQRMYLKYNQSKLDIFQTQDIVKQFKNITEENGIDVYQLEGISVSVYNSLQERLSNECEILKDYDEQFIAELTESLVYGTKMYMYCTYFASDLSIMQVPGLRKVRGPFYDSGFTTVLDLAMIYNNSHNPNYIKNIGPQKFDRFQRYFSVECKEFETIKEDTGI